MREERSPFSAFSVLLMRMKFGFKLISFFGILFSFGCNNISGLNRKLASFNLPNEYEYTDGGAFILQTALPSQHRPGYFDLIGTGGQFDFFCSDAQPCKCEYTYQYPSQGTQTSRVTAVDQESDLMRCSSSVPQGIVSYDIAIISGDGNLSSNKITVTLSNGTFAGSTFYIDLSSKSSFVNVKRFQCRKLETIMNPLDRDFIDPFQSEDPKIIYPFNFYTTNVSESLLQAQHNANQDWDCTLIPNKDHTVKAWANPYVFSREPCTSSFCTSTTAGRNDVMYPLSDLSQEKVSDTATTNIGARGTFALAKQAFGVFQVPIRAAVAPQSYVRSNYGIIGYAADTVPDGTTSSCPTITLPDGARWVKLWNFRAAAIDPPRYVSGINRFGGSSPGNIACNPGFGINGSCDYTPTALEKLLRDRIPDNAYCSTGTFGCSIGDMTSQPSNIVMGGVLTRIMGLSNATTPSCYNILGSSWGNGAELWQGSPFAFGDATPTPVPTDFRALAWGVYEDAATITAVGGSPAKNFINAAGGPTHPIAEKTPKESGLAFGQFATAPYTDNLFVTTPVDVDDDAMKNTMSSVNQYIPVTYRSARSCDPTSVGFSNRDASCPNGSQYEIPWTIMTTEVGTDSVQIYPVCVVQFYE